MQKFEGKSSGDREESRSLKSWASHTFPDTFLMVCVCVCLYLCVKGFLQHFASHASTHMHTWLHTITNKPLWFDSVKQKQKIQENQYLMLENKITCTKDNLLETRPLKTPYTALMTPLWPVWDLIDKSEVYKNIELAIYWHDSNNNALTIWWAQGFVMLNVCCSKLKTSPVAFLTDSAADVLHMSSEFCAIWDDSRKRERNPPNAQKQFHTKDYNGDKRIQRNIEGNTALFWWCIKGI